MALKILLRQKSGNKLIKPTVQEVFPNAQWEHLSAFRQLRPEDRPETDVLELVSGSKHADRGAFTGFGHTFIRLISRTGDVYSVGFYPDESTGIVPENTPALTMPGMLLNPDKYDLINKHEVRTRIALTTLQFQQVKQYLEGMQQQKLEGTLKFRLLDRNCVWFVTHIAAQTGLQIDAQYSHLTNGFKLVLKPFRRVFLAGQKLLPASLANVLRRVLLRVNGFITNSVYYLLGGRVIVRKQWFKDEKGNSELVEISNYTPMFPTFSAIWHEGIPCLHVKSFRDWQLKNNPYEC